MPWYAVYETATGRLLSVGTVLPPSFPPGYVGALLTDQPRDDQMWDEATRTFVARPAKVLVDRLQDLLNSPAYADLQDAYNSLTNPRKTALRNALARLLGRQRYRAQGEAVEL